MSLDLDETAEGLAQRMGAPSQAWHLPVSAAVVSLAVIEQRLVAAGRDSSLDLFDLRPIFGSRPPPKLSTMTLMRGPATCLAAERLVGALMGAVFYGAGGSEIWVLEVNLQTGQMTEPGPGAPASLSAQARGAVTALAAANGLLYSAGNDFKLRCWDVQSCTLLGVLAEGVSALTSLSVLANGHLLVSAGHDGAGAISVWRLPGSVRTTTALRPAEWCVTPLLAALGGAVARTVPVPAIDCMHSFVTAGNRVHTAIQATGGAAVLSASHTGELQVWDVPRQRLAAELSVAALGHSAPLSAIAFAGDALCTASGLELHVTRCPEVASRPASHNTNADATASYYYDRAEEAPSSNIDAVEAMLRGVEEAADELTGPSLST